MKEREIFYKDKEECHVPFTHIVDESTESIFRDIDELYGAADVLSIQNGEKHRKVILLLSVAGTFLTLAFLLYDEAELHGLILGCGVMILCLALINTLSKRLDCHRKYLQYRVLAESLRVQFFLFLAGLKTRVVDILPWSIKKGIPWIEIVLQEIHGQDMSGQNMSEKQSILDCWVRDQKNYHEKALVKTESKYQNDGRIAKTVLAITIVAYVFALIFEFIVYKKMIDVSQADLLRAILKIVLGTMSAITLFTGNYYGKMSLSNVIDDHKRMISLYKTAEERILQEGEDEDLILFLAREYLNENSTWYAYQSKNKPDIVM